MLCRMAMRRGHLPGELCWSGVRLCFIQPPGMVFQGLRCLSPCMKQTTAPSAFSTNRLAVGVVLGQCFDVLRLPLTRARLRASVLVSDRQIDAMQGACVLRGEHTEDGAILAIQQLDVMALVAGPALAV